MTPSPGLPSAHPAAYVPVTLVDGPGGGAPYSTGVPSAPRIDLPSPRRPLDAVPGRPSGADPTQADPLGGPVARGTTAIPAVPGSGAVAAPPERCPEAAAVPPARGPGHSAVPVARWRALPAPGPTFPGAGPFPAGTPFLPPCPVPAGPAPAGVPPHLAAALNRPARPGTVTAAGVLWILVAAVDGLAALAVLATGALPVVVPVLALLLGAATAGLAVAMLRGSDAARTAVTILGGVAGGVVLLPLLLFVPAVIVTLHPSSTAWFADARQRRAVLSRW